MNLKDMLTGKCIPDMVFFPIQFDYELHLKLLHFSVLGIAFQGRKLMSRCETCSNENISIIKMLIFSSQIDTNIQ